MKATVFLLLWGLSVSAQDIDFTNRIANFNSLEGKAYLAVTLIKGDLDGLVWRDGRGGGGRICYTNLEEEFLGRLGIPAEWIDIARDRAGHKAVSDARYQAANAAQARLQLQGQQMARADMESNATLVAQDASVAAAENTDMTSYPSADSGYTPIYPNPYSYYPVVYMIGPGSAARAPSAPSALPARSARFSFSSPFSSSVSAATSRPSAASSGSAPPQAPARPSR